MTWSVIATLAGVAVTAVLGTLAIVREQSVVRQLERVNAVLKDMPAEAAGYAHLEWLRGDLARRVNLQYRAPRQRYRLFWGWYGLVLGGLFLVIGYAVMVALAIRSVPETPTPEPIPTWLSVLFFCAVTVSSFLMILLGMLFMRRRAMSRLRWSVRAAPTESAAPHI